MGKAIAAHGDDREAALDEFEKAMFARSATAGLEALQTFKLCFDDVNAPHGLLGLLSGGASSPAELA